MKQRRKSQTVVINPLVVDLSHHNDVSEAAGANRGASLVPHTAYKRYRTASISCASDTIGEAHVRFVVISGH